MRTMGKTLSRSFVAVTMIVLLVGLMFSQTAFAAPTDQSDDFSGASLNTSFWTADNGASPQMVKPSATENYVQLSAPAGKHIFSTDYDNAPVIWHDISSADFSYEVKFVSPIYETNADSYKVAGIVLRDNSNPATPKYFRFDFNSTGVENTTDPTQPNTGSLDRYAGYLNAQKQLVHVANIKDLPGSPVTTAGEGLYITVSKSGASYTVTWKVKGNGTPDTITFNQGTYDAGFQVTEIGIFAGTTGSNPLGATVNVDYFKDLTDDCFVDDGPNPADCGAVEPTVEPTVGPTVEPTVQPTQQPLNNKFWLPVIAR